MSLGAERRLWMDLFIVLPLIAGGVGTWSFRPSTAGNAAQIGAMKLLAFLTDVGRAFLPADRLSSRSRRQERRLRP